MARRRPDLSSSSASPSSPRTDRRAARRPGRDAYRIRILGALTGSLLLFLGLAHMPMDGPSDRVGWRSGSSYDPITVADLQASTRPENPEHEASDEPVDAPPPTAHTTPTDRSSPPVASASREGDGTGDRPSASSTSPDRTIARMATLDPSEQPDMIGGIGSLYMNIRYPREAVRRGIEGRVVLHFRITEDGTPTQIQVARSLHPLCDSAAVQGLRAVRFAPAVRDGRRIPVYMKLPVRFQITGPSLSDGQRRDRSDEDRPRND